MIFHLVLRINQILFCSERQYDLNFYVIYTSIVCNTNQNKFSAASVKICNENQYSISSCSLIYPTRIQQTYGVSVVSLYDGCRAVVRPSKGASTLSNINISVTSGPIAIKFYLKHY